MKCLALSVNQSHSQRKLVHHRGYPYRLFVPDSLEIILGKTFFCTPSCQTVELLTRSHCTLNRFKRSLHKVDLSGFITIQWLLDLSLYIFFLLFYVCVLRTVLHLNDVRFIRAAVSGRTLLSCLISIVFVRLFLVFFKQINDWLINHSEWSLAFRAFYAPCGADADIIFLPSGFFFYFPRLISAISDWMPTNFHTWCGLSANLGCKYEMCCTRLAENTGRKKSPKIRHLGTIAQICRAISLLRKAFCTDTLP